MNTNGMFYTNVSDYETKEDMMNDFIALRMYDMAKDKEIERLTAESTEWESKCYQLQGIIKEAREYIKEHIIIDDEYPDCMVMLVEEYDELLEILDKENNDIELDMLKALNTDLDDDVEMG